MNAEIDAGFFLFNLCVRSCKSVHTSMALFMYTRMPIQIAFWADMFTF